jgi:5-methylcytosine-specific restriction protein B
MSTYNSSDYARLAASILGEVTPAVDTSIRHNLAILRAIQWGAHEVVGSTMDFDPRGEWWRRPERRFQLAFLSDTWQFWPSDASMHPALEKFCVALATGLDGLRDRGEVTHLGVEYEPGLAEILAPIREFVAGFQDHGWARCRPKSAAMSAGDALTSFVDRVARDGFEKNERTLKPLMRWWATLGARSPEQLVSRQRFFWLYRLLTCTTNAYVHAGAQNFGPVIGNTKVSVLREVVRRWRDGATPDEVQLWGLDRMADEPSDRSKTSIVRELWGFLNLHRGPFFNAKAEQYLGSETDPIRATLGIGAGTREWLIANPTQETQLATAFTRWLTHAQRAGKQPLFIVRLFKRKLDANGNAKDSGAPLDEQLDRELTERGTAYLLERFDRRERAMIMLHLALDAEVRPHGVGEDEDDEDDPSVLEGGSGKAFTYKVPGTPGIAAEDSSTVDVTARFAAAKNVWIYSPGEQASGFGLDLEMKVARLYWSGIGDLHAFGSRADIVARTDRGGDSQMLWAFSRKVVVGDILVARKGRRMIVGLGRVVRPYFYAPESEEDGPHQLGVDWFWTGAVRVPPESTSFTVWSFVNGTPRKDEVLERVQQLPVGATQAGAVDISEPEPEPEPPYEMEHALEDLFFTQAELKKWLRLLEHRRNLVLTGPPGVGKTFVAQRLAWLLIGAQRDDAVTFVQFHQAYSYEQFVLGYRPAGGDRPTGGAPNESKSRPQFELSQGPLFRIAEQAHADPNEKFVLIIDEINRGNISRILGEALMLLEADKREPRWGVELAYRPEGSRFADGKFHLPPNLYVIGTMNTADRSLAVVDYALRRRFAFVDIKPRVDSDEFARHVLDKKLPESVLTRLRECVKQLNSCIDKDGALGPGFEIGHSFFTLGDKVRWRAAADPVEAETLANEWLDEVFEFEIEPLLREYWAEDAAKCNQAIALLRKERPQA